MKVLFDTGPSVVVSVRCLQDYPAFTRFLRKLGLFYQPYVLQYSSGGASTPSEVPPAYWLAAIAAKIRPATDAYRLLDEESDPERGYSVEL